MFTNCLRQVIVLACIGLALSTSGCQRRLFTPDAAPPAGSSIVLCRNLERDTCTSAGPQACGARSERDVDCVGTGCPLEDRWQTYENACAACDARGVWKYVEASCVGRNAKPE